MKNRLGEFRLSIAVLCGEEVGNKTGKLNLVMAVVSANSVFVTGVLVWGHLIRVKTVQCLQTRFRWYV